MKMMSEKKKIKKKKEVDQGNLMNQKILYQIINLVEKKS